MFIIKNEKTFLWILKQSQTTFSFVAVRVMASEFFSIPYGWFIVYISFSVNPNVIRSHEIKFFQ